LLDIEFLPTVRLQNNQLDKPAYPGRNGS